MQTTVIKQKLHQYIDNSDEKLLKLMFVLAKEYHDDVDDEFEFTTEEIKGFDDRRKKRLAGDSNIYGWSEAKEMIIGNKKTDEF